MKIAIVGTGISGMVAAYLLNQDHEITVYESSDRVGGHTNTVDVSHENRNYAVDTGFIVFNEKTYPNFVRLMKHLGVAWQKSEMTFSVKCLKTGLEFRSSSINSLFAQRRNILRPWFYRMVLDLQRFKRDASALPTTDPDYRQTLASFIAQHKYTQGFVDYFIVPMGAAIWSSDPEKFLDFPMRFFADFFQNHGFLNVTDQPQWLVIKNGSRQYIEPLTRNYRDRIRLNCPVRSIRRSQDGVSITSDGGEPETYDRVVIAAHSDQAIAMLADPSDREREILGNIHYQENCTVLHTDHRVLPERKRAWASWNYLVSDKTAGRVALTYNMNRLQRLRSNAVFCVSLNLSEMISPEKTIAEYQYAHPVYTPGSLAARRRYEEINGENRTFYCGAYWYNGFHEDGVKSALAVAEHFGKTL